MKTNYFCLIALLTLIGLPKAYGQIDIRGIYERNQFSIYLTGEKYAPHKMIDIDLIKLGDRPFISQDDMTAYYWQVHLMQLTPEAYDRVLHAEPGLIFVACLGKRRLFWGTICAGTFFDGMVATKPGTVGKIALFKPTKESVKWYKTTYGSQHGKNLVQLASEPKPGEDDPLLDTRIGDALVKAEKLLSVDKPLSAADLKR